MDVMEKFNSHIEEIIFKLNKGDTMIFTHNGKQIKVVESSKSD